MAETVYIFTTWQRQPTYHDYGRIAQLESGRTGDVTKCGRVLYDDRGVRYHAMLRRDHADLFARPCGHCFSGEERE